MRLALQSKLVSIGAFQLQGDRRGLANRVTNGCDLWNVPLKVKRHAACFDRSRAFGTNFGSVNLVPNPANLLFPTRSYHVPAPDIHYCDRNRLTAVSTSSTACASAAGLPPTVPPLFMQPRR